MISGSRILFAVAGLTAGAPPLPAAAQAGESTCVVQRITDGDTIRCGDERVRLLLIDAPEENQGPFGRAAHAFLEAILPAGSHARIVTDVEARDQYDRLLAYVYRPDGRMVNHMMIRQGFAVPLVVPPNVLHVDEIRAAADSARAAKLGLWAIDAFACLPEDFRDGVCAPTATPEHILPLAGGSSAGCASSYPEVCIPPPPPDLDCGDIRFRRFRVTGSDPHRMDGDHDGMACEGS
ncbi:MAG TPA: thermonuclease family protein [Gemmatimonadota bacterium]|nr:thermonuclease family protein [Gemmatimonadota bacterium]